MKFSRRRKKFSNRDHSHEFYDQVSIRRAQKIHKRRYSAVCDYIFLLCKTRISINTEFSAISGPFQFFRSSNWQNMYRLVKIMYLYMDPPGRMGILEKAKEITLYPPIPVRLLPTKSDLPRFTCSIITSLSSGNIKEIQTNLLASNPIHSNSPHQTNPLIIYSTD